MRSPGTPAAVAALLLALAGCGRGDEHGAHDAARLYDNLGSHHRTVTVAVPDAQRWFDQGLRLAYAFNHEEAIRSFERGLELDSTCAMCAWGKAWALGPNINAPMPADAERAAHAAAQLALARMGGATPAEQALIRAVALRFAAEPDSTRRARLDTAFADAMAAAAVAYPDDDDVLTIAAAAVMELSPWDYWNRDGTAPPATRNLLRNLETVIARSPEHPGACHFYIHAVEAKHPQRAVACAERLASLMPGAGHLVHMPGHIYIRVGRWADAIRANEHAVHADDSFFEGPGMSRQTFYGQAYAPHNWHFMAFAATMAGNRGTALLASHRVAEAIDPAIAESEPLVQTIMPLLFWTHLTFGNWDSVLALPLPPPSLRFVTGMAHHARGVAMAAQGRVGGARVALDSVTAIAAEWGGGDPLGQALAVAREDLSGHIALADGSAAQAVTRFRAAARMEDGIMYMEPPFWFYPIRHSLGKALLLAGRAQEAERAYREDLERFPENVWSLTGLRVALERLGRRQELGEIQARLEAATRGSDVRLEASRF
jgi:tetratricopeptide (TPR) repeat protein